jgi:hypothetical protein
LEHQLEAEREANREHRRLLAAALDRIPLQLEDPAGPPQTVEEGSGDAQPHLETRGRLTRAYSGVLGGGGCSDGNAMETFSLGDTIRVELDLRDESGVSTVSTAFYELNSGVGFMMRGESEGENEVTVALLQEVTNEILPGEYRCEGVTVYDVHLNRKTVHPDIRFRVENIPGDHEGPELLGWRVSKE